LLTYYFLTFEGAEHVPDERVFYIVVEECSGSDIRKGGGNTINGTAKINCHGQL
jgi:hypothetical protein